MVYVTPVDPWFSAYLENKRGGARVLVLQGRRDLSLELLGELRYNVVIAPSPTPAALARLKGQNLFAQMVLSTTWLRRLIDQWVCELLGGSGSTNSSSALS